MTMEDGTRVAVVTGGGQGIGKAVAGKFLEGGFMVAIGEKDDEAGLETEAELQMVGQARFIETDVSSEKSVMLMVDKTIEAFGRIDVLVNNAGIWIEEARPIEVLTLQEWEKVISTNLTGAFLCSKYCVPYLKKRRGSIVNIASTRAVMSEPCTEAYAASKGGIMALTHALAVSLGPSVSVNCVSPGWVDTSRWKKPADRKAIKFTPEEHGQHPAGRIGKPEDIAEVVYFLASLTDSFITGANFVVDGGMTRKMIYI
jgi:NAD(P)-dependent dehydrogenase (short-subunit alcohol dehydrogenase family)